VEDDGDPTELKGWEKEEFLLLRRWSATPFITPLELEFSKCRLKPRNLEALQTRS